jgi:hypothetical protein
MYLPPHTTISLADLQSSLSQLPASLLLLGDFKAHHHLWGSIDDDKRRRVIETLISRGNLVVVTMGEPTHISLATGNPSCLDLAMCSLAMSAHFMWRLLDDLAGVAIS